MTEFGEESDEIENENNVTNDADDRQLQRQRRRLKRVIEYQ